MLYRLSEWAIMAVMAAFQIIILAAFIAVGVLYVGYLFNVIYL